MQDNVSRLANIAVDGLEIQQKLSLVLVWDRLLLGRRA